jgi:hypothetical protein
MLQEDEEQASQGHQLQSAHPIAHQTLHPSQTNLKACKAYGE